MQGLCIVVGYHDEHYEYNDRRDRQHWLVLCQSRPYPHIHPHRKNSGEICSRAHSYMTEAFADKRYAEVINTGLVYAMTANYHGCISITPGAFICKVCDRAVWNNWWVTDEGLVHLSCTSRCYLCGSRSTKTNKDFGIKRRSIPHSGLKRNLCSRCQTEVIDRSWQCTECRQLRAVWFSHGLVWNDRAVKCNSCYDTIRRIEDEYEEINTGRRRLRFEKEVCV
jgi:hypothetical protein